MKRKLLSLLTIILLSTQITHGQSDDNNLQIHAPNTYALAKYGDTPVDYSTGVPGINIPLMSLSDRDLTVDVSLSYHASGIKVDEEASWVGLGWALNAGGVITRQVRDEHDGFDSSGRFNYRTHIDDYNNQESLSTYAGRTQTEITFGLGSYDMSPDIFYYNFAGHTGKFVLDDNAQVHFLKHEDFKATFTTNGCFTIIDTKGVRYEFNQTELVENHAMREIYTDAWYLSKIVSPSGGEITFTYKEDGLVSRYFQTRLHSTCYTAIDGNTTGTHSLPVVKSGRILTYHTTNRPNVLTKITASNGNNITFVQLTTKRQDAEQYAYALDQIVLNDASNQAKKKIKFGYSYFEANTARRYKDISDQEPAAFTHLNYRLRLDRVTELSGSNQSGPYHRFEYFGDNNPATDDAYTLPYRLSPSQDLHGYYNKAFNNHILPANTNLHFRNDRFLTDYIAGNSSSIGTRSEKVEGGNRAIDTEAVKAGTLNKIIYPTGGYTQFEYEPHGIDKTGMYSAGGIRIRRIEDNDGNGSTVVKEYAYGDYEGTSYEYYDQSYSPYHTLIVNPFYDSDFDMQYMQYVLAGVGVPSHLMRNRFILRVNGSSNLSLGLGSTARYAQVTEKITGGGRTEYKYTVMGNDIEYGRSIIVNGTPITDAFGGGYVRTQRIAPYDADAVFRYYPFNIFDIPNPDPIDNSWQGSFLTSKEVYNEVGSLVTSDSIYYDTTGLFALPSYKAADLGSTQYLYARSYIIGGMAKLKKEVNKVYTPQSGIVRTVKEYNYTSPYHKQVTEQKVYGSAQETVTSRYYYPVDYNGYFSTLASKNFLSPVDTRTYTDNQLTEGVQVSYNANCLPTAIYQAAPNSTDIAFNANSPFTFTQVHTNTYGTANLWQSAKGRDNVEVVYLWAYKKQHPVAQIINATYAQVQTALGYTNAQMEALINNTAPDVEYIKQKLRAGLPNAQITVYKYLPLTGIKEITDSNGNTVYYDYDVFNRLKETYYYQGGNTSQKRVLENYDYKYKNQ